MRVCLIFVVCLLIPKNSRQEENEYLKFPKGFTLGVGGSAYQIEGGWNASDKGESIWDRFTHTQPWKIDDGSNGDIACDSFRKYKKDVHWIKEMGLDHYRFSISWSRVLPTGFPSSISQEGLQYYRNLVDELLANDIEPVVLLYHWDHPQVLEDMGGWINESMVELFTDYADIIFREFGRKVKIFSTFNEPKVFCSLAYVRGVHAPGEMLDMSAEHLCVHNILKAHARAYRSYDETYRSTQNGKIGIVESCTYYYAKNLKDTLAAEIAFQFNCGRIFHPIFVGDYPQVVRTKLAAISRDAGLPESLLEFSPEWIEYIRGTFDFLGLNHYTTHLAEFGPNNIAIYDFVPDVGLKLSHDPRWEKASDIGHILPESFGHLLRKIKKEYNNAPVYVMENGMSADNGTLKDYQRIRYHHLYLRELLLAVHRHGCDVRKYTFWSLMDHFEWEHGYDSMSSFGLIHVNFSTPDRERTPKLSAFWLKTVTLARQLQPISLAPVNYNAVNLG